MKILESTRLILRAFKEEDIKAFMEYRNNLEWMKYQSFKGLTKEEYKEKLIKPIDFKQGVQLAIILKETECLIGDIYLREDEDRVDLGYSINPEYARKGYTFEIVREVIKYITSKHPKKSIVAGTDEANKPSRNLLLKLGFDLVIANEDELIFIYNK